jgi:hypothetical protein
MILTASVSDRSAVWDTATGNKVIALPPRRLNNPAHVRGGRRSTRFDGRPLVEYESPAIAWSPDGRRVAAGFASDGYTAVWEVPEGKRP